MTQRQKRVLLILGSLNLVAIVLVGGFILRDLLAPPPPIIVTLTACEQKLLAAFPPEKHPGISWTAQQLTVQLDIEAPAEPESAQQLWVALDTLALTFQEGCPIPETLVIAVSTGDATSQHKYLAQLTGDDVAAWIEGSLSEDALAARARYRHVTPPPAQP